MVRRKNKIDNITPDDISKMLGKINTLGHFLSKQNEESFDEIIKIVDAHPILLEYSSTPILSILYHNYKKDSSWIKQFFTACQRKFPLISRPVDIPLLILICFDGSKDILEILVKNGYNMNDRYIVNDLCVSAFNFISQDKEEFTHLLFNGGWRPLCTNMNSDFPTIILEGLLPDQEILKILKYYFGINENPNTTLIKDEKSEIGRSTLLTYLLRRWSEQNIDILKHLLQDPRWTFDSIRAGLCLSNTSKINFILEEELLHHNDRIKLFDGEMYLLDYLEHLPEEINHQSCIQTLLYQLSPNNNYNMIFLKEYYNSVNSEILCEYLLNSHEMYAYMNRQWILAIIDSLNIKIDSCILYDPLFAIQYWQVLKNEDIISQEEADPIDVHDALQLQVNLIYYIRVLYGYETLNYLYLKAIKMYK